MVQHPIPTGEAVTTSPVGENEGKILLQLHNNCQRAGAKAMHDLALNVLGFKEPNLKPDNPNPTVSSAAALGLLSCFSRRTGGSEAGWGCSCSSAGPAPAGGSRAACRAGCDRGCASRSELAGARAR